MAETGARRKGPKRSEASKAAILAATREELAEHGWRKFSVDNVAKRARASKQTIYRWWPSIGTMCLEAGLELLAERGPEGRDPLERLSGIYLPLERAARSGTGHAILRGALMAAADDAQAGERWRTWLGDNVRTPTRMLLAELANKQVVRRDWTVDSALETLLGPIWHRLLITRAPVQEGLVRELAGRVLAQYAVR